MSEGKKIGTTRAVEGREWLMGKAWQDREWEIVRREFHAYVVKEGINLEGEPIEKTEYDEQLGQVFLRITGYAK